MNGFGIQELGVVLLFAWILASGTILPNWIEKPGLLSSVVIVGGTSILFGFDLLAPRTGPYLMVMTLIVILAAGLAVFKSEVLFRSRNGYWRYLGRSSDRRVGPT
jgi:hypothetical protein